MEVDIVKETCCTCHVSFWITATHRNKLKTCKNTFYCPNGHGQSYTGKSDADKLRNAEERLRDFQKQQKTLERSRAAYMGIITKLKKGKP